MAIRSVAELLPVPFEELTLDHVPDLLVRAGEERETMFFERKASVSSESLAKSCAAFANTLGGLVVVGVADDYDALTGIEIRASEAQVWVKDMLRGYLLPLPSFRARWLPLSDDPDAAGILLVMVPQSSTTPHLLTKQGAIYVRNPGSSDPVPIGDQRLLLELVERGERAQQRAAAEAQQSVADRPPNLGAWEELVLVPTGVPEDYRSRLFSPAGASRVLKVLYDVYGETPPTSRSFPEGPVYLQHQVHYTRWQSLNRGRRFELAAASVDGAVLVGHGFKEDNDDGIVDEEVIGRLPRALAALREFILDLGGHGDLELAWRLSLPDTVSFHISGRSTRGLLDATARRSIPLEQHPDMVQALVRDVVAEIARAGGIGPKDDTRD